MQEISKLQGVFQKISFLFPFSLSSSPARRRPACFTGRRPMFRPSRARIWPWRRASSLSSLSHLPLFAASPLSVPETPEPCHRRDLSPPAIAASPRRSGTTTGTAVLSSPPTPSTASRNDLSRREFVVDHRTAVCRSPPIPPPPTLLRPRRPHHRAPCLTVSLPMPFPCLLSLGFTPSPESRSRRRAPRSPEQLRRLPASGAAPSW